MNDTIRIQNNPIEHSGRFTEGREDGLDSGIVRLQESFIDETYTDGYIDYVQEL